MRRKGNEESGCGSPLKIGTWSIWHTARKDRAESSSPFREGQFTIHLKIFNGSRLYYTFEHNSLTLRYFYMPFLSISEIGVASWVSINIFQQTDRSARLVGSSILVIDLSSSPITIVGECSRACNPLIRRPIDTPEISSEIESNLRCSIRNNTAMRDRILDWFSLARVDVGELEACGSLMLGEETAFRFDDQGLRCVFVTCLTEVDRIVRV
jgi:hypothetical protein